MEPKEEDAKTCARCERNLDIGVDAIAVTEGVIGPRGFVPLDESRFFCSNDCLLIQGEDHEIEKLPRRIP